MNTLRRVLVDTAHQIAIDFLRHEGNHGRGAFTDGHERGIKGHVRVNLILLHSLRPETLAASSHIPVAHLVHKVVQNPRRLRDSVIVQMIVHFLYGRVQLRQQPLIHNGKLLIIETVFGGVKVINIGIEHEKGIGIPKRTQELALSLLHRLAVETVGQPGCGIDIEIPADRIRAVGFQRFKGIHRIALALAHLLTVLILHMPQHDHVLKGRAVKQKR